jgi:hypothetical protein
MVAVWLLPRWWLEEVVPGHQRLHHGSVRKALDESGADGWAHPLAASFEWTKLIVNWAPERAKQNWQPRRRRQALGW